MLQSARDTGPWVFGWSRPDLEHALGRQLPSRPFSTRVFLLAYAREETVLQRDDPCGDLHEQDEFYVFCDIPIGPSRRGQHKLGSLFFLWDGEVKDVDGEKKEAHFSYMSERQRILA